MSVTSTIGDLTDPATLASGQDAPSSALAALSRGQQLDRFVLLDELGRGGMGVVWSAYDPELDRKIAIKLLSQRQPWTDGDSDSKGRFRREAQLMAKLRHPNVVTLFEVGRHGDELFLAMEYVEGGTLVEFAKQLPPGPDRYKQIVTAYVGAARGMAAAHGFGVIHGDFKPANVLSEEGRPQVADFGLARSRGSVAPTTYDPDGSGTSAPAGTPRYMAPELFEGEPADELSDQFAFCVSLYESLFGESPFEGKTPLAMKVAILENNRKPRPTSPAIPSWLWDVIERGLSADPKQRWPSMADLADTLESPEGAGFGRDARTFFGVALGIFILAVPVLALSGVMPDIVDTYTGSASVPIFNLAVIGLLYLWARDRLKVSAFNRRAIAGIVAFFAFDFVFWGVSWAIEVPIEQARIVALIYWATVGAMFGALLDRRAYWIAAVYGVGSVASVLRPEATMWSSLAGGVVFILLIYAFSRNPPRTPA